MLAFGYVAAGVASGRWMFDLWPTLTVLSGFYTGWASRGLYDRD